MKLAPSSAHVISLSSMRICQSLVRNAGAFGNDISSCCERDELVSSHDARLISARSVAFVIGRFSSTESPAEELLLFGVFVVALWHAAEAPYARRRCPPTERSLGQVAALNFPIALVILSKKGARAFLASLSSQTK